jgi:fibronectin type 3 domain-containing protein
MNLFGTSSLTPATKPTYAGLQIQTSVAGLPIPLLWGTAKIAPNLIDYDDFISIPHTSTAASGGKAGGSGSSGSTSYTYQCMTILALCEGQIDGIPSVWADKDVTTIAALGMTVFNGSDTQMPWDYVTTHHPTKARSYQSTAYVANGSYDLGSSANLPSHQFETAKTTGFTVGGLADALPSLVIADFLTNSRYGVGFPSASLGDLTDYGTYCQAMGIFMSPLLDTTESASSILDRWTTITNSALVWSGGVLKIIPYGDTQVTGHGATFTPNLTPVYDLTYDDFLRQGDEDPVSISRSDPADAYNEIQVEIHDRALRYNPNPISYKDQNAIEQFGLRSNTGVTAHEIKDAAIGALVAQLMLQRGLYIRNSYSFRLGWIYSLLEPMDLVTLTDPGLNLNKTVVRITAIDEGDDGTFTITAEEFPPGVAHATAYPKQGFNAYQQNYAVAPGPVNTPVIIEPGGGLTGGDPEVWIAASGSSANWGGCSVWLSADNVEYKRAPSRITAPARMGITTGSFAAHIDPDAVNSLGIDLSESGGVLLGGTRADADGFRNLAIVGSEIISFQSAALTGANLYTLGTYIRRGLYGSAIASHVSGEQFAWLGDSANIDPAIFRFALPAAYIGQPLYVKLTSFNQYGVAEQQLADVAAYAYTPNGAGSFVSPPSACTISVGVDQTTGDGTVIPYMVISWSPSSDPLFDQYEVQYRLHSGPGPWIDQRIGAASTSIKIRPISANTAHDAQVRAVRNVGGPYYSAWSQQLNVSTVAKVTPPNPPTNLTAVGAYAEIDLAWTASTSIDVARYFIYESTDATFAHASQIDIVDATNYPRKNLGLAQARYYWVAAVDRSGNISATAGPVTATTLAGIPIAALGAEATQRAAGDAQLTSFQALLQAAMDTATGAALAIIKTTQSTTMNANEALAKIVSIVQASVDAVSASVTTEASARVSADTALAGSITTTLAVANGAAAAVTTEASTRATAIGNVTADYTIKTQVLSNGTRALAAIGLVADATSAHWTSEVDIIASKFVVIDTDNLGHLVSISPFFVQNGNVYVQALYAGTIDVNQLTAAGIMSTLVTIQPPSSGAGGLIVLDKFGNTVLDPTHGIYPGSIKTVTLGPNAATSPGVANMASAIAATGISNFITIIPSFTVTVNDTGNLEVIAGFNQSFTGAGVSRLWAFRLYVDGTLVATPGGGVFNDLPVIVWAGSVGSGSHTVQIDWAADNTVTMNTGAVSTVGFVR